MRAVSDILALIGIENDKLAGSESLNDIDWLIGMDMLSDSERLGDVLINTD